MERLTKEAEAILIERFGKDSIIALATAADGTPYVRNVNAFILMAHLCAYLWLVKQDETDCRKSRGGNRR